MGAWRWVLLTGFVLTAGCSPEAEPDAGPPPAVGDTAAAVRLREGMVSAIETGIRDADPRVLEAMRKVPRHLFVPNAPLPAAYDFTSPYPIGQGQTISAPEIVALMSSRLALDGTEKVLEIGTGSGYQAAVLAEIAREVFTIEILPELGHTARERLKRMGYGNVHVRVGDGYRGWPAEAPFDAIIVTAAPPATPPALLEQLAPGGRMIVPVGEQDETQWLTLHRKDAQGKIHTRTGIPVRFVPMVRGDGR
jgi:protein-L-isoaspartate(D-aspartate) O-methyltransferase